VNSLDAAVAKAGAGIVRMPSRQAEADPAAGRPVQLLVDCEPGPAPWHLMFQRRGWLLRRSGTFAHYVGGAGAASIPSAHYPAYEQNHCSVLKPCQMAVVYQAADQSRFIAS